VLAGILVTGAIFAIAGWLEIRSTAVDPAELPGVTFLLLKKPDGEVYVWVYDDDHIEHALLAIQRSAVDGELSFSREDADHLISQILENPPPKARSHILTKSEIP